MWNVNLRKRETEYYSASLIRNKITVENRTSSCFPIKMKASAAGGALWLNRLKSALLLDSLLRQPCLLCTVRSYRIRYSVRSQAMQWYCINWRSYLASS